MVFFLTSPLGIIYEKIRSLGFGAFIPAPLPLRQDKNKICSLQKSGSAKAEQKEKHTSYNSVYLVTVRLRRAFTHILLRYAPQNIRYTRTLCEINFLSIFIFRFYGLNNDENLIFIFKTYDNGK